MALIPVTIDGMFGLVSDTPNFINLRYYLMSVLTGISKWEQAIQVYF